ncbi:MAG: vitamin K epoxide reductase family protein [Candidatus Nanopelagicales bacterium]
MSEPEGPPWPMHEVRHRWTFVEMLLSSIASLVAALVLSVEAWLLAKDPNAIFSCDVNNKISCGTVAESWQATLLGFPNAYLGLIFESVVITVALASLSGVRFPRRFMLGAHALYTIAVAFAYWLFLQAYFVIGALCPWCLLVTAATTLVFTSITRVNILDRNITFGRYQETVERYVRLGADTAVALLVLAVIAAMVAFRYL